MLMRGGTRRRKWGVSRKAQNFTELALVIGIAGLVFIAMEVYIKRGISGKVKDLTCNMIGSTQDAYSVDTSGLEVNESGSELTLESSMTESTVIGGGVTLSGTEESNVVSWSESLDSP